MWTELIEPDSSMMFDGNKEIYCAIMAAPQLHMCSQKKKERNIRREREAQTAAARSSARSNVPLEIKTGVRQKEKRKCYEQKQ